MTIKVFLIVAIAGFAALFPLEARHHRHNEGVHLAAEIVGLVKNAIAPAPKVVVAPAPVVVAPAPKVVVAPAPVVVAPAPVVVAPPPKVVSVPQDYDYVWYRGIWVPRHRDWYWYNNAWIWVGRGHRPPPPAWRPDFRRPIPTAPPAHHRPAPVVHHRPAPVVHHRPAPVVHHRPAPVHHHRPAARPQPGRRW